MSEETKPTEAFEPAETTETAKPSLDEQLRALLTEHNAELAVRLRTPRGDAQIDPFNFVPVGWTFVCVPVIKN